MRWPWHHRPHHHHKKPKPPQPTNGVSDVATVTVSVDGSSQTVELTLSAPSTQAVFYGPDSIWNARVDGNETLDPNSATLCASLLSQTQTNPNGISSATSGLPIYTVPADQPTAKVTITSNHAGLQTACDAVPIPPNAKPSVGGTDQRIVIHQPSTDTIWEFWRLAGSASAGWSAGTGGRMFYQSQNPGYFRNVQSPSGEILEQPNWGGVACSLGMAGGAILIDECLNGTIEHALCLALKSPRAGQWAAPCQRTDGSSTGPSSIPEGAHFRIDPTLDIPSLGLGSFPEMMALAMQKYGVIINNTTGDGQAFRTEDPAQYKAAHGYDPFMGPNGPGKPGALYSASPATMLSPSTFPWKHLQLLEMDLRTTADNTLYIESIP